MQSWVFSIISCFVSEQLSCDCFLCSKLQQEMSEIQSSNLCLMVRVRCTSFLVKWKWLIDSLLVPPVFIFLTNLLLCTREVQTQSAEMVANPNKPFPWWDVGGSQQHQQQLYGHDAEPSMTALQLLPQLGQYKLQPLQPNLQEATSLHGYVLRLW